MEILNVILSSVGSVIVLFLLTKLMGKRQVSQLSLFDYINGITIGSIAAEMATSLQDDFLLPLIAMVIYSVFAIGISYISCKSLKFRRFFTGTPSVLYDNGKLYEKNLLHARMDIGEFLTECRTNGYFDLQQLQTVLMELNGKLSFLPMAKQRPATPQDFSMQPQQDKLVTNLIVDGILLPDNLKFTGNDKTWLFNELKKQKAPSVEDIFLATCDCNNQLVVYPKTKESLKRDIFE